MLCDANAIYVVPVVLSHNAKAMFTNRYNIEATAKDDVYLVAVGAYRKKYLWFYQWLLEEQIKGLFENKICTKNLYIKKQILHARNYSNNHMLKRKRKKTQKLHETKFRLKEGKHLTKQFLSDKHY